jgi:hypothetical protein
LEKTVLLTNILQNCQAIVTLALAVAVGKFRKRLKAARSSLAGSIAA